jgi:urease beta subunit
MDTVIDPKISAMMRLYNAEIDVYKAEVQNYLDNPVGVGEHGNLIETMDTLVAKIAEAEDKLIVLETHFNE